MAGSNYIYEARSGTERADADEDHDVFKYHVNIRNHGLLTDPRECGPTRHAVCKCTPNT